MSINIWKLVSLNKIKIPETPWSIIYYSKCARNTFLYIPELNIAFDAGFQTELYPTHIFISHAHLDHISDLMRYVIDPVNGAPNVFVPQPSKTFVKNFIESGVKMTKNNADYNVQWNIAGVSMPKDSQTYPVFLPGGVTIKGFKFDIELIKSNHSIATTGYGLIEKRKKLKPEFESLKTNQKELEQLKTNGIVIDEEIKLYHFCYLGDTDHHVFYEDKDCTIFSKKLEKYRTIIVECTFINDEDEKQAKKKKHMLLSKMLPFIQSHSNITFMLCHFSMRYKDADIIDHFKTLNVDNIVPLVHDFDKLFVNSVVKMISNDDEYAIKLTSDELIKKNEQKMKDEKIKKIDEKWIEIIEKMMIN